MYSCLLPARDCVTTTDWMSAKARIRENKFPSPTLGSIKLHMIMRAGRALHSFRETKKNLKASGNIFLGCAAVRARRRRQPATTHLAFPLSSGRYKAARQIGRHLHIDSLSGDLMLAGYQFDAAALMPLPSKKWEIFASQMAAGDAEMQRHFGFRPQSKVARHVFREGFRLARPSDDRAAGERRPRYSDVSCREKCSLSV